MLIDRIWHSIIQDVDLSGTFTVIIITNCGCKIRERLAVSKLTAHKLDVGKFNLRKLSKLEVKEQYQIKTSNRFAALEKLYDSKDIYRTWENIKGNIKPQLKESRLKPIEES